MKKITTMMAVLALAGFVSADVIVIDGDVGDGAPAGWTQLGNGAGNATKDNLDAENNKLWGVSNTADKQGLLYNHYASIVSTLPSTIQAGTYTLSLRIGNGNSFNFTGYNDISTGVNTDIGAVAGFFATIGATAEATKNNMYTEFIADAGVTYSVDHSANPVDGLSNELAADNWVTWTFTWDIAEGSDVIGSNPYFGVYERTGSVVDDGAAFFDDSSLTYAIPEPATLGLVAAFGGALLFVRRRFMI